MRTEVMILKSAELTLGECFSLMQIADREYKRITGKSPDEKIEYELRKQQKEIEHLRCENDWLKVQLKQEQDRRDVDNRQSELYDKFYHDLIKRYQAALKQKGRPVYGCDIEHYAELMELLTKLDKFKVMEV